jgi:16S rRNA (cytosine967-C5)-methyltransferase
LGLLPQNFAGKPELWPGYQEGLFSIQDESSQLVPYLTNPERPPTQIFDACAGLGGKTLALANIFPEASILAIDNNGSRLDGLRKEARRLKAPESLKVSFGDIFNLNFDPTFDLVVVDAPCSGLGVIRRRPDLKWNKFPQDIFRNSITQLQMLEAASQVVAPGGRLIYSVCTITPEEGPEVFQRFLENNPEFHASSIIHPEFLPLLAAPGQIQLWPHRNGTDGFFYGILDRS